MSLLGRPKAKTHKALAMDKLLRMAGDVEEIAEEGQVSSEAMEELSEDLGIPGEKLYAGLGMSPAVEMKREHDVQFLVCTGGCQEYGALDCVRELLDVQQDRRESGDAGFDLVPRHCLNRCQSAPVVEIRSPEGQAVITDASPERMQEAVDELLS